MDNFIKERLLGFLVPEDRYPAPVIVKHKNLDDSVFEFSWNVEDFVRFREGSDLGALVLIASFGYEEDAIEYAKKRLALRNKKYINYKALLDIVEDLYHFGRIEAHPHQTGILQTIQKAREVLNNKKPAEAG